MDQSTRHVAHTLAVVGFDALELLRRFRFTEQPPLQTEMSKSFKQASELFLTRRFSEAYEVIDTLVTPSQQQIDSYAQHESDEPPQAPVATLKINTRRIKIWVLYISILNAIVDLGEHEGAEKLGEAKYQEIVTKVRSGGVWDKVKDDGYQGDLGTVDPEVAFNLAMLQLGQSASQVDNQARIRKYLAASPAPSHDHPNTPIEGATSQPAIHIQSNPSDKARYRKSYLDVIELFVLHILPRNGEWEYARTYVDSSSILEDERKVSFILTLNQLLEDSLAENAKEKGKAAERTKAAKEEAEKKAKEAAKSPAAPPPPSKKQSETPLPLPLPATLAHRAGTLASKLEALVRNMASSLGGNPALLLRLLLSAVAIIMVFGKGEARERAKRILARGWEKVRDTVGMGVKISYV